MTFYAWLQKQDKSKRYDTVGQFAGDIILTLKGDSMRNNIPNNYKYWKKYISLLCPSSPKSKVINQQFKEAWGEYINRKIP